MSSLSVKVQRLIDAYVGGLLCLLLAPFAPRRRGLGTPRRILVVRLWAIGESILILPMIHALKTRWPDAQIDVLTRARNAAVFTGSPDIDVIRLLEEGGLRGGRRAYDLAIDTEPFFKLSALLAFWFGRQSVGFSHGVRSRLYTYKVRYNDRQHVALTYLDMLRPLGIDSPVPATLVPLSYAEADAKAADDYLASAKVTKKDLLIGVCATAAESAHSRLWAKERFAELADRLAERHQAKLLFVGTKVDIDYNQSIIDLMQHREAAINGAGKSNIKQLFALVKHCRAFVSNDTGPMHVAAAQGVPTVGLFCPNTPVRFAPYGPKNISIYKPVRPEPCINVHTGKIPDCRGHNHMANITVDDVYAAVKALI